MAKQLNTARFSSLTTGLTIDNISKRDSLRQLYAVLGTITKAGGHDTTIQTASKERCAQEKPMILLRLLAIIVLLVVFSPACRANSLDSEAAQGCASYTTNKTGPQADGTTGHTTNLTGTQSNPPNLLPTTTMGLAPIFANGIGCTGAGFPCCMTCGCGAGEFGGCPGGGCCNFTPNCGCCGGCGGCGSCTKCALADCICAAGCYQSGHGTASISLPGGLGGLSISF